MDTKQTTEKAELVRVPGSGSAHSVRWRGQVKTLQEWAAHLGVKYNRLYTRLFRYGWDLTYVMETATEARPKPISTDHLKDPEAIRRSAETRRETCNTPEHREKMSRIGLGLPPEPVDDTFRVNADINPMVWGDRQGKHRVGTQHSAETRQKMSETRAGLAANAETLAKMAAGLQAYQPTKQQRKKRKITSAINGRARSAGVDWKEMDGG